MSAQRRILFVCLGNTCRSPMAHGYFRHILQQSGRMGEFSVDSAGTRTRHVGGPPDRRAQVATRARGFDISDLRSRQVTAADFEAFDIVLAVDCTSREDLVRLAPQHRDQKVRLLLEYAPATGLTEIPDPWHGGAQDYERALDLISVASEGLLIALSQVPSSSAS